MFSDIFKNEKVFPIGLEIGPRRVKMIQLGLRESNFYVLAAEEFAIPVEIRKEQERRHSFIVSHIQECLKDSGFKGREVVSVMPSEQLKITSLRLEEDEGRDIEEVLEKEAQRRFGLSNVHYLFAGTVKSGEEIKNEVVLFAVNDDDIAEHIKMIEESGLEPVAIDTEPVALFRNFSRLYRRQRDKDKATVLVDVGSAFTTVVFARGGEITFIKQIDIGGEDFNEEVSERLSVTLEEAEMLRKRLAHEREYNTNVSQVLSGGFDKEGNMSDSTRQAVIDALSVVSDKLAKEISLCFRYYTVAFRGKRIERALFSGDEAYESVLLNTLKRRLTVEITIDEPLRGIDISGMNFGGDRRNLLCDWSVAVGLGLKNASSVFMESREYARN